MTYLETFERSNLRRKLLEQIGGQIELVQLREFRKFLREGFRGETVVAEIQHAEIL